jgi:hypothetical protein
LFTGGTSTRIIIPSPAALSVIGGDLEAALRARVAIASHENEIQNPRQKAKHETDQGVAAHEHEI